MKGKKNMKILFIWPRTSKLLLENSNVTRAFVRFFSKYLFIRKPMAFSILAALTPEKHSIEVIEGDITDIDFEKDYDLVGITSITSNALLSYKIADEFRNHNVPVVLGGYHPSALPEEAKEHADAVVVGESEETWPKLLRDFENKKLRPFYNQQRIVNPENIPKQKDVYKKGTGIGIQASRGCPNRCEFCSISNMKFGNIFRKRPIDSVIEDINRSKGKLFVFQDNSLTIDTNYTKKLFRKLIGINKKFFAYGNIGILGKDDELLRLASEAGCLGWMIGFESVCQKSIDSIGKRTNVVSEYIPAIKKIHNHGMLIQASFVLGFDFDKKDIFSKTEEFVRKSEVGIPFGLILTPYPGTKLYDRLDNEKRILTKDWDKYNGSTAVFKPANMTAEYLTKNTDKLNDNWHKYMRSIERIIKNMSFGFYSLTETLSLELYYKMIYQKFDKYNNNEK